MYVASVQTARNNENNEYIVEMHYHLTACSFTVAAVVVFDIFTGDDVENILLCIFSILLPTI